MPKETYRAYLFAHPEYPRISPNGTPTSKVTPMKAWELQGNGLESLELVDRPTPTPGPHELLVRVAAVSLNHRDQDIMDGDCCPPCRPGP